MTQLFTMWHTEDKSLDFVHSYMNLLSLNIDLETDGRLPAALSREWIWGSDPGEALNQQTLLNRSHLLGLLVCRHRAFGESSIDMSDVPIELQIARCPPQDLNLRQLRDTLDNLCVQVPKMQNVVLVVGFVDACFARFGRLLSEAYGPEVLNDPISVEDAGEGLLRINRPCIRRTLNCFLLLFRRFHMVAVATVVPAVHHSCGIHKHHMEASNDDFDLLCMRWCLPVGAVINYRNDFSGFYNHISQVVYFHYTNYERTRRCTMQDLATASSEHILPAICLLHPDIKILYEEDNFDITKPLGYWAWIILPGQIYLFGPNAELYQSADVTALLNTYLQQQ